jgi:hypothetical protein
MLGKLNRNYLSEKLGSILRSGGSIHPRISRTDSDISNQCNDDEAIETENGKWISMLRTILLVFEIPVARHGNHGISQTSRG